MQFIIV